MPIDSPYQSPLDVVTDAKAKVTLPDGKTMFGENKAGDVFWDPASTARLRTLAGQEHGPISVEMKTKAWQPSTG